MKIVFNLITDITKCKDKSCKKDYGYYDYDKKQAIILLYTCENLPEKKLISEIISTINHELLHGVIWEARKQYKDEHLYDFFEEKIIRETLGEEWNPEDYYEHVQIDEDTFMKYGTGDKGITNGGVKGEISKCDCLCEVTGDIDSLHSSLNKIAYLYNKEGKENIISQIYDDIKSIAGKIILNKRSVNDFDVFLLDEEIKKLSTPTDFQRFTTELSIELNEARVRTRKLERTLVDIKADEKILSYVNRLSTLFFVMACNEETMSCVNCGDEITDDENPYQCNQCNYTRMRE